MPKEYTVTIPPNTKRYVKWAGGVAYHSDSDSGPWEKVPGVKPRCSECGKPAVSASRAVLERPSGANGDPNRRYLMPWEISYWCVDHGACCADGWTATITVVDETTPTGCPSEPCPRCKDTREIAGLAETYPCPDCCE